MESSRRGGRKEERRGGERKKKQAGLSNTKLFPQDTGKGPMHGEGWLIARSWEGSTLREDGGSLLEKTCTLQRGERGISAVRTEKRKKVDI